MKDYCTWFPELWVKWVGLFRWKVVSIKEYCKDHDDNDDTRGGCASHTFARDLFSNRIVGAILIFIVASIACWIKYPSQMIRRI